MRTNESCSIVILLVRVQIMDASRLLTIINMFCMNKCFLRMGKKRQSKTIYTKEHKYITQTRYKGRHEGWSNVIY